MTTVLDPVLPGIARQVLDTFGTAVTLRLMNRAVYDPATMESLPGAPTDVAIRATIEPASGFGLLEGGGLTTTHDEKVTFAAQGLPRPPTSGDRLVIGGVEHELGDLTPIYSGDLVAAYQARIGR